MTEQHPIEGLMVTAMNSIQDMVDVNTIIGEPIETSNNTIIIPISKVSFGFAAGGSEFKGETIDEYTKKDKEEAIQYRLPFGGGSGAGVSINPIAFLVVQSDSVKLLPVNHSSCIDKLLDYVPEFVEKANETIDKCINAKKEDTEKMIKEIQKNIKKGTEDKKIYNQSRIKNQDKNNKKIKKTTVSKDEYEYELDEDDSTISNEIADEIEYDD